ncbi:hypothetical protein ACFQ3S_14300 [Mucilaginibacter terrae]|uniref:hypothetical protein n=1 Tax=Mucilaginibacter terrae TaxID=1955052 RepID=UPI00363189FC
MKANQLLKSTIIKMQLVCICATIIMITSPYNIFAQSKTKVQKASGSRIEDSYTANDYYLYNKSGEMTGQKGSLRASSTGITLGTDADNLKITLKVNQTPAFEVIRGVNGDPTFFGPGTGWTRYIGAGPLAFFTRNRGMVNASDIPQVFVASEGQVGIGTNLSAVKSDNLNKYNLFVMKGVLSEDYAIGPKDNWADYIFKKDYSLLTYIDLEKFISINGHLPGIPSAQEIKSNGYSLHDMNVKLLSKIEELTLYSIEQQKEIIALKKSLEKHQLLEIRLRKLENSKK